MWKPSLQDVVANLEGTTSDRKEESGSRIFLSYLRTFFVRYVVSCTIVHTIARGGLVHLWTGTLPQIFNYSVRCSSSSVDMFTFSRARILSAEGLHVGFEPKSVTRIFIFLKAI